MLPMIEHGPLWWAKKYALPIATMVVAGSVLGAQDGIPSYPVDEFPVPAGAKLATGSEDVQLRHLAMRLLRDHKDNSFEPTETFTVEFFERVRNATFQIELPVTGNYKNVCTGWLVDRQAQSLSIITAAHCLPKNESFEYIYLSRPGIDIVGFWHPITEIQQDAENDTAMITVDISPGIEIDAVPLSWEDNYVPTDGNETYLTVGFPYSFYMQGTGFTPYDILTYASVSHQAGSLFQTDSAPDMWALRDIGSNGLSGGGVFRVKNGNPIAIGLADEKETPFVETIFGAHLYVQPLHINKFFENRFSSK